MKDYDLFNYKKNITVVTTPKGDKVITINDAAFTALRNAVYDGAELCLEQNLNGTYQDRMELWKVLTDANKLSEK